MNTCSFFTLLTILSRLLSIIDTTSTGPGRAPGQNWLACYYRPQRSCGQEGTSGTDYNRLEELRNKLKDLQNVVENYNTVLEDSTQDLGKDILNKLRSSEVINTFPQHNSDDKISFGDETLLQEVKEKLQLLQSLLDDKSKDNNRLPPVPLQGVRSDQRPTVTRSEDPRATVTRTGTDDQRATFTRNEDHRATVTKTGTEDQRGTVTPNKDQRATVTRTGTDDQRATVTRNEDHRATVTKTGTEDQRGTVTRNEDQRATVTRTGTDDQRATVTKAKNSLSAEDAELVKKLESKFLYLKTFLLEDSNADTAKEKFKNQPEDSEHILNTPSSLLVRNLAPGDLELLENIQEKIRQYQRTRSQGSGPEILGKNGDVEAAVKDTDMVKDDTFEKNQKATKSKEIWQDVPLPDDRLGIQRDVNPSENVVEEVKRRFLSDIRYARENGVDIAQLLRTLPNKSGTIGDTCK